MQPPAYGHYFQPVLQHMPQHSGSSIAAPGTHVGSSQQVQPQIDHLATSVVQNTGTPQPVFSVGSQQSPSQAIIVQFLPESHSNVLLQTPADPGKQVIRIAKCNMASY